MKILLIEDDSSQRGAVADELERKFRGAKVIRLKSEIELVSDAESLFGDGAPDVMVLDVWMPDRKRPRSQQEVESFQREVQKNGKTAGMRCAKAAIAAGFCGPIILYTILEKSDLIANSEGDDEISELVNQAFSEGGKSADNEATIVHLAKTPEIQPLVSLIKQLATG